MHIFSNYYGNRPTHTNPHKQTGLITIHCAAKLSMQCKDQHKQHTLNSAGNSFSRNWISKVKLRLLNKITQNEKSAQRDVNTAHALAVVRFRHRLPTCPLSQTHRQDRLQYTAPQLASAQCNKTMCTKFFFSEKVPYGSILPNKVSYCKHSCQKFWSGQVAWSTVIIFLNYRAKFGCCFSYNARM